MFLIFYILTEIFTSYLINNKCNKSDMVLIDDNVTHLLQPHMNGYNSFQTSWGNVPKEYLAIANNYGIEVISKENLRDRMKLIE